MSDTITFAEITSNVKAVTRKFTIKNRTQLEMELINRIYDAIPKEKKRLSKDTLVNKFDSIDDVLYFLNDIVNQTYEGMQRVISLDEIKGKRRYRDITNVRQFMCYFLVHEFKWSKAHTGRIINRDHSTVIHALTTIDNLISTSQEDLTRYSIIKQKLNDVRLGDPN